MPPRRKLDWWPLLPKSGVYMKRPLFVTGCTFAGSLLFAAIFGFHIALVAAGIGVLFLLVALAITSLHRNEAFWAVVFSAVAAFSIFSVREHLTVRPLQQLDGKTVSATVQLTEEVTKTDKALAYYAVVKDGGLPKDTKLLVWVRADEDAPDLYNLMTASFYLTKADQHRADGVYLTAWADGEWTVFLTDQRPVETVFHLCRRTLIELVHERADGDVAALIAAICFGHKEELSQTVKAAFRDAGLSHMMAVSGFHVSAVVAAAVAVLYFFGVNRRRASMISLPLPLLFAAITGLSYSALRAAVMVTVMLGAAVFRRKADGKNSLGGALLLILLVDPNAVYDVGFQLSATATLGILIAGEWQRSCKRPIPVGMAARIVRKIGSILFMSVAAILAILPILALNFGYLAVLSPISNLLAQPAAIVILIGGCLGTLLLAIPGLGFLASPLFLAAGLAARYLIWLTDAISGMPAAVWLLNRPYLLIVCCALPFLLVLGWHLLRGRGLRMVAMLAVIALAVSSGVYTLGMRGVTVITAANLADGMAVLLERDGHAAVVITGDGRSVEVTRFLSRRGIDRLDFILYTETVDETSRLLPAAHAVYAGEADERAVLLDEHAELTFWNDSSASLCDGWLWLNIGETRVLVCPSDGDTAELIDEERRAALVLFDHTPPHYSAAITAGMGILCCDADQAVYVAKALPVGGYPVTMTDESVSVKTRGYGDIT